MKKTLTQQIYKNIEKPKKKGIAAQKMSMVGYELRRNHHVAPQNEVHFF